MRACDIKLDVHEGMTREELSEAIGVFQRAVGQVHEAIGLWVSVLQGYADEIDAHIVITHQPGGPWMLCLGEHATEIHEDLDAACEAMVAPLLKRDFEGLTQQ